MKHRGCLPGRGVRLSSKGGRCLAWLGGVSDFHFPPDGSGQIEVRGHRLIQGRTFLYPFASAPSTEVRAEEDEARRRAE